MKDIIQIDATKALVIEGEPGVVTVAFKTYGIPAFLKPITPDQAEATGYALLRAAQIARNGADPS